MVSVVFLAPMLSLVVRVRANAVVTCPAQVSSAFTRGSFVGAHALVCSLQQFPPFSLAVRFWAPMHWRVPCKRVLHFHSWFVCGPPCVGDTPCKQILRSHLRFHCGHPCAGDVPCNFVFYFRVGLPVGSSALLSLLRLSPPFVLRLV